jgi:hypothetical protein
MHDDQIITDEEFRWAAQSEYSDVVIKLHDQVTSLTQALDSVSTQFGNLRELCYLKDKLIGDLARWIQSAYGSAHPASPALLLAKAHAHTAMAELKADYQTPAPQYPQPSPEDLASQLLDCVDDFIGGLGSNEAQKLKARFIRILTPQSLADP